jgi:hypothetical protein
MKKSVFSADFEEIQNERDTTDGAEIDLFGFSNMNLRISCIEQGFKLGTV